MADGDIEQSLTAEVAVKRLEVTNLIYDFINDTSLMPNLIDGLSDLDAIDPDASKIFDKLDHAAELAEKLHRSQDVDITRDVGLLVVGISHRNRISHVPQGAEEWLGVEFKAGKEGIGWLIDRSGSKCLAHYIDFGMRNHLPIDKSLIEGLKTRAIATLIVVYQFQLSEPALAALQELYDLTPSELRLCNQLGQGKSLREAATETGVGLETNRTHLKRIFQKMGINRQTELVRTVTQISAAASIYDVSRRRELDLISSEQNSIRTTHTAFLRTRRGTKLCYSCYGDPNGTPLLFFHHTLGCRILTEEMISAAHKAGILLYTFDRPGYGESDPIEPYSPAVLAECIEDFLDAQGIDRIDAVALAISGRSVLDAIPYLGGRISTLDLYSFRGASPISNPKHLWNHFIYLVIKNSRHVGPMVRLLKAAFTQKSVVKNMQSVYGSSPADKEVVASPKNCFYLLNVLQLACKQNGIGPSNEFGHLRKPFEPDPTQYADTKIRAHFGDQDQYNPMEDAEMLLAKIPDLQVNAVKDAGQLYLFQHFDEFLLRLN